MAKDKTEKEPIWVDQNNKPAFENGEPDIIVLTAGGMFVGICWTGDKDADWELGRIDLMDGSVGLIGPQDALSDLSGEMSSHEIVEALAKAGNIDNLPVLPPSVIPDELHQSVADAGTQADGAVLGFAERKDDEGG